jgi:hypothetical protein
VFLALVFLFDPRLGGDVEQVERQLGLALEHGQEAPFDLSPERFLFSILLRRIRQRRVMDDAQALEAEAADAPTCSKAPIERGAQGRSVMRSVGLDLGARHIAWCEVVDGAVTRRGSVRRLDELEPVLGVAPAPAKVAFEASREAGTCTT